MSEINHLKLDESKARNKTLSPKQWHRSNWLKTVEQVTSPTFTAFVQRLEPQLTIAHFSGPQMQRRLLVVVVAFVLALVIFVNVSQTRHAFYVSDGVGNRSFMETETDPKVREIYSCYHKNRDALSVELLEDIQLSSRQPKLDTSIFFVITTCLANNLVEIRRR